MLDIDDLMQTGGDGRGVVNILAADRLMTAPALYATFLLWMLSELFERLPEVGDPEKPKMVFFFDEAHLLFTDAPDALVQKIEQVVRLIRSKGVGVYFVTQNPLDIPDTVLGQLGNRVQHALRAFTPRDQKAVRTAAQTLRSNPALDVEQIIMELGVGEALVSFLDEKGDASHRRTRVDSCRRLAHRSAHAGGAPGGHQRVGDPRALRADGRSRVGVREAAGSRLRAPARQPAGGAGAADDERSVWPWSGAWRLAHRHPLRYRRSARRQTRRHPRVGRPERRPVGRVRLRPRESCGASWGRCSGGREGGGEGPGEGA